MTIIQLGLREKILLTLRKDSNLLTTTDWNLIFFTEDIKQNELFVSHHARRTHISKISCYIKWLSHNAFKVFEFLWELSKVLVGVEEVLITENWINMPSKKSVSLDRIIQLEWKLIKTVATAPFLLQHGKNSWFQSLVPQSDIQISDKGGWKHFGSLWSMCAKHD